MKKHAYLIMAHGKFKQLIILLKLLDNAQNDIFLHIDKKVKTFPRKEIIESVCLSKLYFSDRINVNWGAFSQIQCELLLLEQAVRCGNYQYLHLLSGVDLPIKSQEYIHQFFENNKGIEFIDFDVDKAEYIERCMYFWPFREELGRRNGLKLDRLLPKALIARLIVSLERRVHINRIPNGITIKKGANWFSITGEFAKYIVSNKKRWDRLFKHSLCADELFVQTIVFNSPFRYNIYFKSNGSMRLIDWNRGNPYIFKEADFDEIKKSNCLFARKFDIDVDKKIIYLISDMVNKGDIK